MRHEFEVRCEGNGNQETKDWDVFQNVFLSFSTPSAFKDTLESKGDDVNIESTAKLN